MGCGFGAVVGEERLVTGEYEVCFAHDAMAVVVKRGSLLLPEQLVGVTEHMTQLQRRELGQRCFYWSVLGIDYTWHV